jgi:hypothetical protein
MKKKPVKVRMTAGQIAPHREWECGAAAGRRPRWTRRRLKTSLTGAGHRHPRSPPRLTRVGSGFERSFACATGRPSESTPFSCPRRSTCSGGTFDRIWKIEQGIINFLLLISLKCYTSKLPSMNGRRTDPFLASFLWMKPKKMMHLSILSLIQSL